MLGASHRGAAPLPQKQVADLNGFFPTLPVATLLKILLSSRKRRRRRGRKRRRRKKIKRRRKRRRRNKKRRKRRKKSVSLVEDLHCQMEV